MFVRRDSRGYYTLMESFRDPVTGKHRQRSLAYLGRISAITWRKARRQGVDLDALMRLGLAGKIELRSPVRMLNVLLGHDGQEWTARQAASDRGAPDPVACRAPTLSSLAAALKSRVQAIEEQDPEDPEDAEVRVDIRLEPEGELSIKELRLNLYALNQPPLRLRSRPQEPPTSVLDPKGAVKYLKNIHRITTTVEALAEACRRGRLSCLCGSFAGRDFGPMVRPVDHRPLSLRTKGTKNWGGIGYLEDDLDLYASAKGLPEESAIAMMRFHMEKGRIEGEPVDGT